MSTLIEIEEAADTLPVDEKVELVRFLTSRIQSSGDGISGQPKSLLGAWQGLVTFNEGSEEPLHGEVEAASGVIAPEIAGREAHREHLEKKQA